MAENCDFADARDEQIRDRIVIRLLDKNVSQSLQMKSGLDLQTAVELARQAELVKSQSTERESLETKQIDEVQRRRCCRRGDWNKRQSLSPQQQQPLCGRCNRMHAKESQCPAQEVRNVESVLN